MNKTYKIFSLLFLTIVFSIIFFCILFRPNMFENFKNKKVEKDENKITFNVPKGNNIINSNDYNEFNKFNQNYDKAWMNKQVSFNFPFVQNYGDSYNRYNRFNQYIFNDFTNSQMKKFAKNKSEFFNIKAIKKKYNLQEVLSEFQLDKINKKTWENTYNWNPNKTLYRYYIKSDIQEINKMNDKIINYFNSFLYSFMRTNPQKKVLMYKPYFIYKYRLVQIYENKKKTVRLYQVVVNTLRDNSYIGYNFYLNGLFIKDKNKFNLSKLRIDYMSNTSQDKELIRPNINKDNQFFYVNPMYQDTNDSLLSNKEFKSALNKKKIEINKQKNFLEEDYRCFTYDVKSKKPISIPIFATDKNDCHNKFNVIGQEKPSGVWDKICKSDKECLFFKQNKNYSNNFGRCINGKCQLPLNMKNLGFHYYIDSKYAKPLCYNCNSDSWRPITNYGFCCEEQKDKKKYPFLKSPDYAFENDLIYRFNYNLNNNCKTKKSYPNIFKNLHYSTSKCNDFFSQDFIHL